MQVAAVGELEEREDVGDARGRRGERDLGVRGEGARDIAERGEVVKALARRYGVAPRTIRRVLDAARARDAGDVPEVLDGVPAQAPEQAPEPEPPHVIDAPGLLVEHLKATDAAEIRDALRGGRIIRRGQGYSMRVAAPLTFHQAVLGQCGALAGGGSAPARRKGYRAYADRITAATRKRECHP